MADNKEKGSAVPWHWLIILLAVGAIGTPYLDRQEQMGNPPIIPHLDRPLPPKPQGLAQQQQPRHVDPAPVPGEKHYTLWDYIDPEKWKGPLRIGTHQATFMGHKVEPARNWRPSHFQRAPVGQPVRGGCPFRSGCF